VELSLYYAAAPFYCYDVNIAQNNFTTIDFLSQIVYSIIVHKDLEDFEMNILYLLKIKSDLSYVYDDNSMRQGLEKMRSHSYTAIPVITRDGDYVGTVTEGDFLWHILRYGRASIKDQESYRVGDIVREDFMLPVRVNATDEELIEKAIKQNFVPVVDDRNKFIGIVTRQDIIRFFVEKHTGNKQQSNVS
jgi:predicted transcriptional regulator